MQRTARKSAKERHLLHEGRTLIFFVLHAEQAKLTLFRLFGRVASAGGPGGTTGQKLDAGLANGSRVCSGFLWKLWDRGIVDDDDDGGGGSPQIELAALLLVLLPRCPGNCGFMVSFSIVVLEFSRLEGTCSRTPGWAPLEAMETESDLGRSKQAAAGSRPI